MGKLLYLPLRLLTPLAPGRARPTPELQELAASIREVGVLQPLTVEARGGKYAVLSGNRRLAAARMAGLEVAPCLLAGETDALLISLTENLQREDLHFFQQAELLKEFLTQSRLSQAQAAKRLGRSQAALANKLRLLGHSPQLREKIVAAGLSERHARALLRLEGEALRETALEEIAARGMSVAAAERYVAELLKNGGPMEEKLRRRAIRLFRGRIEQEVASLRRAGMAAEARWTEADGEIRVTVRVEDCETAAALL